MSLSRRQFLTRSAAAGAMLLPMPLWASERPALMIPPLLDVGRGRPVRLDFRATQTAFEAGKLVNVLGANGYYLAPTVKVRTGHFVKLTYINSLNEPLSINIQGLLASTDMVGSAHRELAPSQSWSPILSVQQPACTCWYHADTMLKSAPQIARGLVGMWLIEDEKSAKNHLPNQYGVNDIPLILQDQRIALNGELEFDRSADQFWGTRLFVNGRPSPYLNVPRGWVRLRLVNASLSRPYELRLSNGQPLYVIATGVGMLAEPIKMESVWLSPSERVEVLLDLNKGEHVALISGSNRDFFYTLGQFFRANDDLIDNLVLELRPQGLPSAFVEVPTLPDFSTDDFKLKVAQERHLHIRPLDKLINQQPFDPARVDFHVKQGSVERWYIKSNHAIGFNIQGAAFVIETRDRKSQPYKQLAWRDNVWLEAEQEVTLLVRFLHRSADGLPFSFGVSDVMLRNKGCMGQFSVTP